MEIEATYRDYPVCCTNCGHTLINSVEVVDGIPLSYRQTCQNCLEEAFVIDHLPSYNVVVALAEEVFKLREVIMETNSG